MKVDELDPNYLRGLQEEPKPETENRSLGQLATDVGIKIAEPVIGAARTVTLGARAAEDDPHGVAADVDRWLGRQQKAIEEEGLSTRQRAIDTNKWFNRGPDDRSAWNEPLTTLGSQTLGLVAPAVATTVTGGGALAGMAVGALMSSTAIAKIQDYTDQTPLDELKKLPEFNDLYRNNGGDELDARQQLFKKSVDFVSAATNAGTNMLTFGALGQALTRGASPGIASFVRRAAFGTGEGAVLGAAQGSTGELVAQRAAQAQGRQGDLNITKIVGAGEEAIPGMAGPLGMTHAFRRGHGEKAAEGEQYGPQAPPPDHPHWTKPDTDVTSVLADTINPKAMDTGTPPPPSPPTGPAIDPDLQNRIMAQRQSQGYERLAQQGPEQLGPPSGPPEGPPAPPPPGEGPPGVPFPRRAGEPMAPSGPEPPEGPPGVAPRPTGAPPYRGEPEAPEGPPGVAPRPRAPAPYPGERPAPTGPGGLAEPRPYRPGERRLVPPEAPRPPEEEYTGAPEAPRPPRFPGIERPGLPTPGEFGGEEARAARAPPARTIHVTPEDAQKIRQGVRLVPAAGNAYTLEARGGQSIGRVSAHGQAEGLVPIGFGTDGLVVAKGRPLGRGRPATFDADLRRGAAEGTAPAITPGPRFGPPAPPGLETRAPAAPTRAGPSAAEMHAAPLRPGRALWRSNVGVHEVEILPDEDHVGERQRPPVTKIRYDITDKAGRNYRDEAWVNTDELTQGGERPGGGAGGGPGGAPGGGSFETTAGRPERGTFQEQLRRAGATIFEPTNEPLTEEVEKTIRGGLSPAEPEARQLWAVMMEKQYAAHRRLFESDLPPEMRKFMDDHEWQTTVEAAAQNPMETIEIVGKPPIGGGINPAMQEHNFRIEGRKARSGETERQRTGRTAAQRGGFEAVVRTEPRIGRAGEEVEPPPVAHVRAREQAQEPPAPRQTPQARRPAREAEAEAQRNINRQTQERIRRAEPRREEGATERPMDIEERDLLADVNKHNARVDEATRAAHPLTPDERTRMERIHQALHDRADRLDAARYREGLPELPYKEAIKPVPKEAAQPERAGKADRDKLTKEFNEILNRLEGSSLPLYQMVRHKPSQRDFNRLLEINRQLSQRPTAPLAKAAEPSGFARRLGERPMTELRNRQLPIPLRIYDAFADYRGIPDLNIPAGKGTRTPEQLQYRLAQRVTELTKRAGAPTRARLVEGRMTPASTRLIWRELGLTPTGKRIQNQLMAADRARAIADAKAGATPERREIGQGSYWSSVFKRYWNGLTRGTKGKLLREAKQGVGKSMSPEELRERVIKEVEELHAAARERAAKGLPPLPIITKKIEGMRQKELPRTIPTEREALERMQDVQKRQISQQRREASGDKQYNERGEVIENTLKDAVQKRFGNQQRFTDLVNKIFNLSLIRPPTREYRDNPSLFQRARVGPRKGRDALSGMRVGGREVELIVRKRRGPEGELGEKRVEPQTVPADQRAKLSPQQLEAERREDAAIEAAAEQRYSLREKLRRAGREPTSEERAQLAEEEAETRTAPSRRMENIHAAKMADYFKIKDDQVSEARKLKKFLDFTLEKLAKDLEAKRKREGYTGGTVTWHLPEARAMDKGVRISQQAEDLGLQAQKSLATRKRYSAGTANEQFGAYSFTADLLNMHEALDFALRGIDALDKPKSRVPGLKGGARLAPSSLQSRWNPNVGRKGKVVAGPGAQLSTRQTEIARYMAPLNRQMLDFSWRIGKALEGDWEALKDVRRAQTTEAERGFLGESLEAREERIGEAELRGEKPNLPGEDIGRGKTEKEIQEHATRVVDMKARIEMAKAWAQERKEGRLANMPFEEYVKQYREDVAKQAKKDFPLGERGRGVEEVGGRSTFEYDPDRYRGMGPNHNEEGLPVDRLPRRKEFDTSEPSPREQDAIDAHEALTGPGTPQHPLVAAPETTGQVIDRVKGMIRDGTAGDLPERYISDDFLNQLARITEGTEVYHAPYDAVSHVGEDGWAHYDTKQDRVVLSHDVAPDLYARSVVHETVHAATETRLQQDPKFAKDVTDLLVEASARAKRDGVDLDRLPRDLYGLTNPSEFLTETTTNQRFRDYLNGIKTDKPGITGPKTLLQAAYRAVRNTFARVMGFFHANTALDALYYDQSTVLGKADQLIKRSMRSIERQGRQPYLPPDQRAVTQHADGRYYMRGAGARAFMADAYGAAQAWGKDVADRAEYAWETRAKLRARGLDFMTPYDQTKIGRADFRAGMEKAFDTIEKVFAEGNKLRDADKRELAGAAKIYYRWSKGNRQRAAEAMIDESMHGYFADRELTDRGNEHFTDDLAHAQEKEEHVNHQREYNYLAEHLPGYDQFRTTMHKFAERREEELRKERIRDLIRYGNTLPADLDPATRERVSEAVRRWIDTPPERVPSEGKGKAAERYENLREVLERVPEKNLIKQHVNVDDASVLERIREIRATPNMHRIPGPYVPFTRQGKFAVSGNLDIPKPDNAILLQGDINHATGQPVGNDRYVFKTEAEARAFERSVTRELGIKQLKEGSGPIDIDVATGKRAMVPEAADFEGGPERFKLARGKALQDLKDAGANIEQHYAVQFQKKLLYYAPTEFDAKKITDDLKSHYGDRVAVTEPKDVFIRDGRQNEQFVGTALQKQIDHLRQSDAFQRLDRHEQAAVIDNLKLSAAQQVMNRGVKARYLPRGYVKGASTNILGSMDEYSAYTGRYLAKMKHQAELKTDTDAVGKWLKDNEHYKDVLAEQRVYNSMMHRLHSPTENPRDNAVNRAVDRALKWTMLDKLPGVGYFVANATDAVAVGLPLMAGRHGMIRALGMMGTMYRLSRKLRAVGSGLHDLVEAIRNGSDMTDYEKQIMRAVAGEADGGRLGRLYQHAFDRAMFDRSANLEYQNTYMLNKSVIDRVGDYGTGIFQGVNTAIEAVNRFVTLGTAYRLEFNRLTKKGMGEEAAHEAAVQYAMNIGHEANGIYANFNTPEYFNKGPIAKLIFQFKKYPQRIMMNYIRAGQGAIGLIKGERTPENIERAKQLGYMLATQGILAGTLGMPTEMFSIPLNAMYMAGISKYNWDDAQNGFRQWAAKEFGKEGGAVVSHGLLRYLTNTALDQRLSQDSMLTFGSPGSRKQTDIKAGVLNFFMGATGSSAFQKLTGVQQLAAAGHAYADGADDVALKHLGEAGRNLSPLRFVTDIITAANKSTIEGTETFAGRPMMKPYTAGEQALRSIGIQPAREAEAGEERRYRKQERQNILDQKKTFTDQFVQSPTGAQRERVWQNVLAWNQSHPDLPPLTRSDLLKAAGTRAKAEKAPSSMLGLPDDKTMQALRKRGSVYLTGE